MKTAFSFLAGFLLATAFWMPALWSSRTAECFSSATEGGGGGGRQSSVRQKGDGGSTGTRTSTGRTIRASNSSDSSNSDGSSSRSNNGGDHGGGTKVKRSRQHDNEDEDDEDQVARSRSRSRLHKPVYHSLGEDGFVWPAQQLGIGRRPATERPGMSTWALSLLDLVHNLLKAGPPQAVHGIVVNVGAADGCLRIDLECDEANSFLPRRNKDVEDVEDDEGRKRNAQLFETVSFHGVLIEPDASSIDQFTKTYQNDSFTLVPKKMTYGDASSILDEAGVPTEFDVLKYDTDGADCQIIERILEIGYRPSILMAEYNIVYPPPIRFNQLVSGLNDDDDYFRWGASGPFAQQLGNQCSLSYLVDVMTQYDYTLIQVDWWDAFFVRSHLVPAVTGGAPIYDAMTWYLHGYVANAPSDQDRLAFLERTAYAKASTGVSAFWIDKLAKASSLQTAMIDDDEDDDDEDADDSSSSNAHSQDVKSSSTSSSTSHSLLTTEEWLQMRTEFWWSVAEEGYVQVKDVHLVGQRGSCHAGCVPQPFTFW